MKTRNIVFLTVWLTLAVTMAQADTRLMRNPTISAERIAFVYDGDIWIAERNGSHPRRVTTSESEESTPLFSPDGRWLAFSANYDGNQDIYLMPAQGGEPKRLTWHPAADRVVGFTPDGSAVLIQSRRKVHTNRYTDLYTVSLRGGMPKRLPVPHAWRASLSNDAKQIAYNPLPERWQQWKNYRGGTVSRIWIMDMEDSAVNEIPQPQGRSNDSTPIWLNDSIYFISDRNGEFNLFVYDTTNGKIDQLTEYDDFPVTEPTLGDGKIVFEQAGWLHVFNPETGEVEKLSINIPADQREARPRFAEGAQWVRNIHPGPDGKRAVLEFRGEIVSVPVEHGFPRNLSTSTNAHDRSPVWSPDGRYIAWFSDDGGEYQLQIHDREEKTTEQLKLNGSGFYLNPKWSPDSQKIAYQDNSLSVYIINVDSLDISKVAQETVYSPIVTLDYNWSPDSAWLAYTLNENGLMQTVQIYHLETETSRKITQGLGEMSSPVFSQNGEFLFMLGSIDSGPVKDWFAQSNADAQVTHDVYALTLKADGAPALPLRSDEVAIQAEPSDEKDSNDEEEKSDDKIQVQIDFDGLINRIQKVPAESSTKRQLQVDASGNLYWLETSGRTSFDSLGGTATLKMFSLEKQKAETIGEKIDAFQLSADGKHLLHQSGEKWLIGKTGGELKDSKALGINKIKVKVDPRNEWPQIFKEAWRINRDYFYATNYHGVDWDEIYDQYAPLVEQASTRSDVSRIIRMMASELAVGHSYSGPGETILEPADVNVGLLGADFSIDRNRYRIDKIYGGLNWQPNMRSPLASPGVQAAVGDYLIEVNGHNLRAGDNLYQWFENTANQPVKIKLSSNANGSEGREIEVVPIANEQGLRNLAWVENNLKKVDEATNGRVAYVYVPNTAGSGHEYFKRYFYPQSHKQAIIVDERYNGGGLVADYYINHLRRPFIANWAMRYGDDLKSPRAGIFGPKVMIIDETAGSGGDLLPWMFRKFDLGPLVGKRTWGGLVGILGFPVLMDGGQITAPNLAIWNEQGWIVENQGVPPDVEVEQWPAAVNAGRDPQLDKAIEIALQALKENPPEKLTRPPYPIRNQ